MTQNFIRYLIFGILLLCLNCKENNEGLYNIGFSQCISNHPWRAAMNESMKLKASLNNDIDLEITQARIFYHEAKSKDVQKFQKLV